MVLNIRLPNLYLGSDVELAVLSDELVVARVEDLALDLQLEVFCFLRLHIDFEDLRGLVLQIVDASVQALVARLPGYGCQSPLDHAGILDLERRYIHPLNLVFLLFAPGES